MTTNLTNLLPLELRSPKKGDQPVVTNPKAQALWIGLVLGDGYIRKDKGHLAVDQASEKLTRWLHILLGSLQMLPKSSEIQRTEREDKRYNKTNVSYRFATRAYKVDLWRETFYEERPNKKKFRKKVPANINELLVDPFSLTIWFLGDGWFDGDNVCFAAGEWSVAECQLLQDCLLKNFGLESSLVRLDPLKNNGREVHRITLSVRTYEQFYKLVQPFLDQLEQQVGTLNDDKFLQRKVLPKPSAKA